MSCGVLFILGVALSCSSHRRAIQQRGHALLPLTGTLLPLNKGARVVVTTLAARPRRCPRGPTASTGPGEALRCRPALQRPGQYQIEVLVPIWPSHGAGQLSAAVLRHRAGDFAALVSAAGPWQVRGEPAGNYSCNGEVSGSRLGCSMTNARPLVANRSPSMPGLTKAAQAHSDDMRAHHYCRACLAAQWWTRGSCPPSRCRGRITENWRKPRRHSLRNSRLLGSPGHRANVLQTPILRSHRPRRCAMASRRRLGRAVRS